MHCAKRTAYFCRGNHLQSFISSLGQIWYGQRFEYRLSSGKGSCPSLAISLSSQVWSLEQPDWYCKIDEGSIGLVSSRWSPDGRHILNTTEFHVSVKSLGVCLCFCLVSTVAAHNEGGDLKIDSRHQTLPHLTNVCLISVTPASVLSYPRHTNEVPSESYFVSHPWRVHSFIPFESFKKHWIGVSLCLSGFSPCSSVHYSLPLKSMVEVYRGRNGIGL